MNTIGIDNENNNVNCDIHTPVTDSRTVASKPWNECSKEEKQHRIDSALTEFAKNDDECPVCNGTGQDKHHRWPDGSLAACSVCEGYGRLTYTPEEKERMWKENDKQLGETYL